MKWMNEDKSDEELLRLFPLVAKGECAVFPSVAFSSSSKKRWPYFTTALAYQMPSRDVLRCDLGMTSEVFPTVVSGLLAWCCLFKSWLQVAQKTPKSVEHELLYPPTKRWLVDYDLWPYDPEVMDSDWPKCWRQFLSPGTTHAEHNNYDLCS